LRGLEGEAPGGRDGHQIVVAKAFWIEELESVLAKTAPVAGEPEATLFAIRCRVFQRQGQPAEVFGQLTGIASLGGLAVFALHSHALQQKLLRFFERPNVHP